MKLSYPQAYDAFDESREESFHASSYLLVFASDPWSSWACVCINPVSALIFIWHSFLSVSVYLQFFFIKILVRSV